MKRLLLAIIILGLAACQASPAETLREPPQTELPSPASDTLSPTVVATIGQNPQPTSKPGQKGAAEDYLQILELVVRDLSLRTGAHLNDIQVLSIQERDWPNAGLGCEDPSLMYAQVITPGYLIILEYQGSTYQYHTNQERAFWLCEDGKPQLPRIPVDPDEIQDGIPWMPVDPVPTVDPGDTIADPDPIK